MTSERSLKITVLPEDPDFPEQYDLLITGLAGYKVTELAYGWQVASFESAFVIQMTTRQDGRTAWSVTLTEVDGNASVRQGLTKTGQPTFDAIAEAVNQLTQHWIKPLN